MHQVAPRDTPVNFEYVGQTESSHQVQIRARVDGFLIKRMVVMPNDWIKRDHDSVHSPLACSCVHRTGARSSPARHVTTP